MVTADELICDPSTNIFGITFGILLTLLTCVSYLPQQIKILRNKSSRGISPLFLFLSSIFGIGSTLSAILLQFDSFVCCTEPTINFWECNVLLLNIYQIAVMPLNILFIFLISVILVDPIPAPADHPDPEKFARKQKVYLYIMAWLTACIFVYSVYVSILLLINWGANSYATVNYARILSVFVFLSTLVQFLPQIYTTFKYQASGSVSVGTLVMQAPGNLIVVLFQLLSGSSFAVWFPFFSSFVQQSFLLVEILFFDCYWKKKKFKTLNYND